MKIPDPGAAKKLTLAGQKRIAEEEEQRAKFAAEEVVRRKQLDKNWKLQSKKLVKAAINQRDFIEVAAITFPRKLMDSGLEIIEIGDITRHYYAELPRAEIIEDLLTLIPQFSARAPDSALSIWRYWEDIDDELKREIENLLNQSNTQFAPGDLKDFLSRNVNFKRLPLSQFEPVLNKLQAAAEKVKTIILASNWKIFKFDKVENLLTQTLDGKYFFAKNDPLDDELRVLTSANKLRILWKNSGSSYFNKPREVICASGLSWLKSDEGQSVCERIGGRIQQAADEGLASIWIGIEAGILRDEYGFVGTCPNEEFFVELISLLGYSCKLEKDPDYIANFRIDW